MILNLPSAFLIYPLIPWVAGVITSKKVPAKEWKYVKQLVPFTCPYPPKSPVSEPYFQKNTEVMEPKLETGPVTVLMLNTIQFTPITFLSCSAQSGSEEPQSLEGVGQDKNPWGGRWGQLGQEQRQRTFLGLGPDVPPLPFLTKDTILEICPQKLRATACHGGKER